MTLPPLYLEGLSQHGLRGGAALSTYKLGLVEALLKDTLRMVEDEPLFEPVRANLRTALDVVLWEPPRPRRR